MIVFEPIESGTFKAVQVAPLIAALIPLTLTLAAPEAFAPLSTTVPLTEIVADSVCKLLFGEVILTVGGVVSGSRRTMTMEVSETFPALSAARAVIVLLPRFKGKLLTDQFPFEKFALCPPTVTLATPDAFVPGSLAVPLTEIEVLVVSTLFAGEVMTTVGAVVSGSVRVTVTAEFAEFPAMSVAVTVIVFAPIESAKFGIVQLFPVITAACPLTLTAATPDADAPVSVTVPLTAVVALVVSELFAGEVIEIVGGVVSGSFPNHRHD